MAQWLSTGYVLMVLYLVKHREKFTFTLILPCYSVRYINFLGDGDSHLSLQDT